MKRRWLIPVGIGILLLIASPLLAQVAEYVPGQIIAKFRAGISDSVVSATNRAQGASVVRYSERGRYHVLSIPPGRSVSEMVEIYSRNPNIEYAEPRYIAHAHWVPNDTYFPLQWNFQEGAGGIHMQSAWEQFGPDDLSGVTVAVIDTGVAYENYTESVRVGRRTKTVDYKIAPDLVGTAFVPGYDFVNNDEHPNDDAGHGTHVTGTIAQTTDNNLGTAGIAYGANIMPVKVLDSGGSGTYDWIADGIRWAADHGADVINMSLGGSSGSDTLHAALEYAAYEKGVVIVCSSGNNGSDTVISYPAKYEECIAVGATRYDGLVTSYSNGGAELDLTAPGGDTTVDQNGDGYVDGILQQTFGSSPTDFGYYFYQGTSMAAPHVSGVAAVIRALNPGANVRAILEATATDMGSVGRDNLYGWGIINANEALLSLESVDLPPTVKIEDPKDGVTVVEGDVTFNATAIDDEDGDLSGSIEWYFDEVKEWTCGGSTCVKYLEGGRNYTVTAEALDSSKNTGSDSISITVVPVNEQDIEVNLDVTPVIRVAGKNTFISARATVTVTNAAGGVVPGATVNGEWSGAFTASVTGVTALEGVVSFTTEEIKYKTNNSLRFDFEVTEVNGIGFATKDFVTYP